MKCLFLIATIFAGIATPVFAGGPPMGGGPRGGVLYGGAVGWYDPYYGAYPYPTSYLAPNAGIVKLDTPVKDAEVFINGSYAGTAGKLKTMTMLAGNYTIELRAPGRESFKKDIFVTAGKTMKLSPDLHVL